MAIDTRAKRQNAAHVGFIIGLAVLPSGAIGAVPRATASWTYGGIAIGEPVDGRGNVCISDSVVTTLGTSNRLVAHVKSGDS